MPGYRSDFDLIAMKLVNGPEVPGPQRLKGHIIAEASAALLKAFTDGVRQGRDEGRTEACNALEHALSTFARDIDRHRSMVSEIKNGGPRRPK